MTPEAKAAHEARSALTRSPETASLSQARSKRLRWHKTACGVAKPRARSRGLSFDITPALLLELFEQQGGRCYWLGVPLVVSTEKLGPERPSVDRIDPALGYTADNVVISCIFANLGRLTMSAWETRAFVELVRHPSSVSMDVPASIQRPSAHSSWNRRLARACRSVSREKNLPLDLGPDTLSAILERQRGKCHWLGLPLDVSIDRRGPLSPSVDRLDNSRGYTPDNVVLTCVFANLGRSTASVEQMARFAANLRGTSSRE